MKYLTTSLLICLFLAGCGGSDEEGEVADTTTPDTTSTPTGTTNPPTAGTGWYRPPVQASWQLQLQGTLNTGYDVDIYDIDLFDTPATTLSDIQAAGHHVICYFSGGSYENWRTDAGDFPSSVLGNNLDGWPGEKWLDIRSDSVRNIMLTRLDLAVAKGCDGVDVDNMDGYTNNPGFPLTAADQLDYNRFMANAAHTRNLAIALKNDLDQIGDLVDDFDLAVNEECFDYNECDLLNPFIQQGKPVLQVEYAQTYVNNATTRAALCAKARQMSFSTLILPLDLDDSFRFSCD